MNTVSVKYQAFEPKKNSVRLQTEERLDQQFPLPDSYVPRSVLRQLGVTERRDQDSPQLTVYVTYSLEPIGEER